MTKITPEQAFEDYLGLGASRSLSKLEARYRDSTEVRPIGRSTVRLWSKKYEWQQRVKDHETKVAEAVENKTIKAEANERWNAAKDLRKAAQLGAKRLIDEVEKIALKSGADAKAMAEAVVMLIGKADVLEGGVSDRAEEVAKTDYASMLGEFRDQPGKAEKPEETVH